MEFKLPCTILHQRCSSRSAAAMGLKAEKNSIQVQWRKVAGGGIHGCNSSSDPSIKIIAGVLAVS